MSSRPTYAVRPGIPSTPSAVETGATDGSTGIRPRPSESANSRQPSQLVTHDPSGTRSLRDATTWPTAPPLITSPTWNGGRYDLTSFIRGTHRRVDRHVRVADQHLALGGLRHLHLDEGEVGRLRNAVRPGGQMDLATRGHRPRS